jgi:predicted Zn-dependent peptidase
MADMVAGCSPRAPARRSADSVAAAIEGAGGSLAGLSGIDYLSVAGSVLSNNTALAMQLLGDAVARPTVPPSARSTARSQTHSRRCSSTVAARQRRRRAFTPGSTAATRTAARPRPATVRGITRATSCIPPARLRPQGALLVVAGDVTLASSARAEQSFAGWTGGPRPAGAAAPPPPRARAEILLVNRPGLR